MFKKEILEDLIITCKINILMGKKNIQQIKNTKKQQTDKGNQC